ncbi:TIGR02147 family protein [Bdellovibrio svalbardensis]|uniref:TIGR02147 family protein n=1 Tax=Bdellovibrio svalbardensis TaxID=2972972 RepID=A0ABT6DM86_9BACT|nr:TIGR02147 family protein [Bdellovibrio svalbardensis]MDG0817190.1 TIGR02147 family protein [Bdellovibrio svalbardensis]
MKRVFGYHSYKKYLKDISEMQGRGAISKLAEAAGCDRTYLSQCLSSKVQLTPDHILGLAEYLNLSEAEEEYFLLLLLFERSASRTAQLKIKKKMEKLNQADLILSKKIAQKDDSNELTEIQKAKYYSSWKYAALHTLSSINEFQSTQTMTRKARLSEIEGLGILKDLEKAGLLSFQNGKWIHSGKNIHIPTGSSHNAQNHMNWRLKAVDSVNNKNAIHYTTLFSVSKKDWELLRTQLLAFIDRQRDTIHASGSEEMYCFCCDLFQPFD